MEDAFNFWFSNNQIQIECTFGKIVMHLVMLWRRMSFEFQYMDKILKVVCLLHNYLVDNRDDNYDKSEYFKHFSQENIDKMFTNTCQNDNSPIA